MGIFSGFLQRMYQTAADKNNSNIVDLLETDPAATYLDLGCDNGSFTLERNQKIQTRQLYGVEIVESRKKVAESHGIKVSSADLNGILPLESNSFSVITANQVIEHLHGSDQFLSEIMRILKPGGYAVISTENASSWCNIFASIMGWQIFSLTNFTPKKLGVGNPLALHRSESAELASWTHVRIYNIRGLREYFELFGFTVEKTLGSGYFPLPNFLAKLDPIHSHLITMKIRKPG